MCRITNEYQGLTVQRDCLHKTSDFLTRLFRYAVGHQVSVVAHPRDGGRKSFFKEEGLCPLGRAISAIFALALLPLTLIGIMLGLLSCSRRHIVQEHGQANRALA